jgi:hypothetical protein
MTPGGAQVVDPFTIHTSHSETDPCEPANFTVTDIVDASRTASTTRPQGKSGPRKVQADRTATLAGACR